MLILAVMVVCGCRSAPKSLVGDWTDQDPQAKMLLELRSDKTFDVIAGNDFAAGIASGHYDATADELTLTMTFGGVGVTTWSYRWEGPDSIAMSIDAGKEVHLKRISTTATALLHSPPGSAAVSGNLSAYKDAALATSCLSNVKQLAIASQLYAQDFDGQFDDASSWQQSVLAYTKEQAIFTCPTVRSQGKEGGYAMNSSLSRGRVSSLKDPQTIPLIFEVDPGSASSQDPAVMLNQARHNGTVSVAYADGHAAGVKP